MATVSDIDTRQLFELARDKTVAGRKALMATVTDLFFAHGKSLNDRERSLMSEILRQLIHDVEIEVRRALAERLADEPAAPRDLVVTLANDAIEVAHPILLRSAALQDPELVEIVHHRTLEHQLAIAMRRPVSEPVSDALVEAGAEDVIARLIGNPDAKLSRTTYEYLVEQSKRVDTYQNPLLRRPDLDPELARRMYWWVSAALRQHILDRFHIDEIELDDALESTVHALAGPTPAGAGECDSAKLLASALERDRPVTPSLLVSTLRNGEVALFEALLARRSSVRTRVLRRILFEPGGEALAILCRALDFPAADFAALFVLSRQSRPTEGVVGRGDTSRLIAFYERMSKAAAERVLRRWQRDAGYLRAVLQVGQERVSHAG